MRDGQTKLKEERKNNILQQQQIEKKCQLKEEIKSLLDRLAKENDKLRGVEEAYYTHGAYVIASRLKKGDTCPVCGNTFNGLGASLKEIKVTKEDVEQQRQIQKNAEKKKDACVHNLDNLQEQIDALGIKEDALFQEEIANRTNKIKELEEKEKALEKKYISLKKEKETLTRTFDQLVEQASLAEKRIEELKEDSIRLEEEIKNIYKDNASNEKEYEEKRIDTLVFRQFKQQIEQYDALYIKNKATIEHLEEKVKGKEIVDIAKEEEELKEKREKLKELTTQYNGYLTDIQMDQQNHDELAQYSKHYDEAEVRMNRYKNLYNVAAGKTTKTHHDSLENYVQSLKIDYLLDIANRKLKKMSNEQFTFIKQEDNGIGLDVFDYYSNSPRKIGDISGGEKFKAALSLALSLTEMISSSASGVKMDSLFIDEGFGRLDPDSLHSAIQILTELADSDKMIGIISHVEELKNSIDHKINIHKSTTGSTIEI
ncbi:MAG: hypothetical protein IJ875_02620 [Solobacterium sp.]|nr:hypothetical protein [Solobacterium sp.]